MLRWLVPLLALSFGCQSATAPVPELIEASVIGLAPRGAMMQAGPGQGQAPGPPAINRLDLPTLWGLALSHNPGLREAAAEVEAARGRWVQAGLYPNPRLRYNQDTIGSRLAPQGNISVELSQEIVTAGKRKLDMDVAGMEVNAASAGLFSRKFEVLTRVRRGYYDYLGLLNTLRTNRRVVATLERGVEATRRQVEKAKSRPRSDLVRLEALLAEARINQGRTVDALEGAWRQLAAEVGVPGLPVPPEAATLPEAFPDWDDPGVLRRVLAVNSTLRQAATEAERARLALDRAKAGAVPNVTLGGGYNADNTDQTAGASISIEAPLPLWDRRQGAIQEAQARVASSLAALRGAETRLTRDTAEALARYKAARRQVQRLARDVLPRLQEGLDLTLKAYQAGSTQVTFSDVLTAEQGLNGARLTLAEARRSLWQAVADLEGLMQLDLPEGWVCLPAAGSGHTRGNRP
jgi:cobalt-zinc-cadmium efflux system outer membrane protein